MPRKSKKKETRDHEAHEARALSSLDSAVALVERSGLPVADAAQRASLPSLLSRCEAQVQALQAQKASYVPRLLRVFPGLDQARSAWWQTHLPSVLPVKTSQLGGDIVAVSPALQKQVLSAAAGSLAKALQREGRPLVVLAEGGDVAPTLGGAALVCHPLRAYAHHLGTTPNMPLALDRFCQSLFEAVASSSVTLLKAEELFDLSGQGDASSVRDFLGVQSLCKALDLKAPRLPPRSSSAATPKYLAAEEAQRALACVTDADRKEGAYALLCKELNYDVEWSEAAQLSKAAVAPLVLAPRPASFALSLPTRSEGLPQALVSGFVERAQGIYATLGAQSNAPEFSPLVAGLDRCLEAGEEGFPAAFDAMVHALSPEHAALSHLLAAAHFQRLPGQKETSLKHIAKAQAFLPAHARWLRVLAASLLSDLGSLGAAMRMLIDDGVHSDILPAAHNHGLSAILSDLSSGTSVAQSLEPVRTIHHFACTGGTLISKCIAGLPDTVVFSEIDPLSDILMPSTRFTPTDLLRPLRQSPQPVSDEVVVKSFQRTLRTIRNELFNTGQNLVLRDHAHSCFCTQQDPNARPTLREMVAEELPVLSVVTVRHPLDSFLSLEAAGWGAKFLEPFTLEEYARRYVTFLERYKDVPVVLYEDFVNQPQTALRKICDVLNLPFAPDAIEGREQVHLSGDSGRHTKDISTRARRKISKQVASQRENSQVYHDLCRRFGYTP
ncbi:sulfotransferase [Shimia sp. R11_0]|uniref:sulfotransferase family protein n=1 Tax=Shimia sp. R11_0 TaxID=2821096 RepID=UPI001ADC0579|nr:sulfotransferase [Shimia sp. R11_0]MBO9476103.1 sulfotransferase [Shimia sp. R11_0]